ncbi:hypothetical protein [Elizabethkingia meningoseptica]|uniref:hypothetical protein n=1 Tax=Elizabethkingia meningoseptica TaxID=238 RepID=UPI000B358411|nr:hypothetical protein [Elizabethkingia meningoseptica]
MKKILLIATIGFAGIMSSKAPIIKENLKKENKASISSNYNLVGTCTVYVTFYNSDGYVTGYEHFTAQFDSYAMCQAYQNNILNMLEIMGYSIER